MTRATRRFVCLALFALLSVVPAFPAAAAPYWLQGFRDYRIVDASGRVAPRVDATSGSWSAYKPVFAPPPLLRARPFYLGGYAGARYGRGRAVNPTGYGAAAGQKACGHVGPCQHGR